MTTESKIAYYTAVFNLLVQHAGAHESLHDDFVFHHARVGAPVDEYRFQGSLGFGGKYYSGRNRVTCYSEDETPARRATIEKTNAALAVLGTL